MSPSATERRRRTFAAIREAGLDLRYCVEPVGPEHTDAEIVQQMFYARAFGATICAVMRRIPVAGGQSGSTGESGQADPHVRHGSPATTDGGGEC